MRPLIVLALGSCLLAAGVCRADGATPVVLGDIPGWKADGPAESFDRRTVFQAIDGAADTYLAYGFIRLNMRSYKQEQVTATVHLYDLGQPINAFGIFGRERPSQGQPLKLGDRALAAPPRQCLMHQNRFYVLIAASRGQFTVDQCTALLGTLSAALPKGTGLPPELSLLPTAHREAGSAGYTPKSCFGLGSLKRCLQARYVDEKKREYTIFALLPSSGQTADQVWKTLREGWTAKESGGLPIRIREIPYRGPVALLRTHAAVLGVVDLEDEAQTLDVIRSLPME